MSWYNDNKIYEYNDKFYSEKDRSCELDDGEWGGDLCDLYLEIEEAFEHFVISEEDFKDS